MRRLVLTIALLGCSSSDPTGAPPDAATPSCATTACVPGASCRTGSGTLCQCFDAGEWSCGGGSVPFDAGFVVDTAPPPDTTLTAPPADSGGGGPHFYEYPLDQGGCAGRSVACTDETTVPNAQMSIASYMMKCGLSCTRLVLELDPTGCPRHITTNNEWVEGGLNCVADAINNFRWPCSTLLDVATVGCPK